MAVISDADAYSDEVARAMRSQASRAKVFSQRMWSMVLVSAHITFVVACATVPITGRQQLRLISNEKLIPAANQQFSRFMSLAQQKNAILSASDSPEAARIVEMVTRVSDRIIEAAGLRAGYKWETVVVKAREPNAFVMPNGKIVVFTGLLPVCRNEAGLAAVLGHEVGHVVAEHAAERVSHALVTQVTLQTVNAALADSTHRPLIAAALGLGAQYGILLPFSREHETEADRIGLLSMAKAGYDPSEAIALWERMEARKGSGPWEFLSTHPSPATAQVPYSV